MYLKKKHENIHQFMTKVYINKSGKIAEQFNKHRVINFLVTWGSSGGRGGGTSSLGGGNGGSSDGGDSGT